MAPTDNVQWKKILRIAVYCDAALDDHGRVSLWIYPFQDSLPSSRGLFLGIASSSYTFLNRAVVIPNSAFVYKKL